MPNILTIDWDYFFKASRKIRDSFPPIPDGTVGAIPDNSLWLKHYKSEYKEIGFDTTSFEQLIKVICSSETKLRLSFSSENHGEMINVIKYICENLKDKATTINITNVDYHHDFCFTGNTSRCDNWARLIQFDSFDWCCRPDSNKQSFGLNITDYFNVKEVAFSKVLTRLHLGYYQYVHLCRSDLYSPPKWDFLFDKLWITLKENSLDTASMGTLSNRKAICTQIVNKEN